MSSATVVLTVDNLGHPGAVHAVRVANNFTVASTITRRVEIGGDLSISMLDIIVGVEPAGLLQRWRLSQRENGLSCTL